MADRSAIDTLRGYFYQFDYTIESLMNQTDENSTVSVECIEDVDINTMSDTTAVQCKYYEKTEYNHSVIAKPIRLMLNHFHSLIGSSTPKLKYALRGHYKSGQFKLTLPIDINFLKDNFLTYTKTKKVKNKADIKVKHFHHDDLGLSDTQLCEFLNLLELDIHAEAFEKQYKGIIKILKTHFNCSELMAENYYYNNALKIIRDISKQQIAKNRTISKKDFLIKIDTKKIIFNEWFMHFKGEKVYFSNLRKEHFGSLNTIFKERFFLIDISKGIYDRNELKELINVLIKKYTKITNQPNPFCPYIFFNGINLDELIEIKNDLIGEDILLTDGFDFEGAIYNEYSHLRKPTSSYPIKIKILNRIENLKAILKLTGRKTEIYQFYNENVFFEAPANSTKHIKIQVQQFNKIKNII